MKIQTFSIVAGTAACNANCPYCISKMTPKQGISLEEPLVNWRNFDKACRFAQVNQITTVLITGKGEPTLYPTQISKFLEKLQKYEFPLIELQTNGIALANPDYEEHLKNWYRLGLTTIAISIVHYKDEKNREIFAKYFPNLETLIKKLHRIGFSVRLSCMILKGYVENIEDLRSLIENVREWKVEQLSLRKLAMPANSESRTVLAWTESNILSETTLTDLKAYVKENGRKLMTLQSGSEVYDVAGQNVCLTDALTIEPDSDNLRQIIFFPDGHLRYDWQYKGAILI